MSAGISQKEYLKKYLSGSKKSETKKKKKKKPIGQGMKIIDDDVDLSKMKPLEDSELDILYAEDAPVIVGIIDDAEEERRRKAHFTSNTWRVINHDDGFDSTIKVEQIKRKIKVADLGGESPKSDSDLSPPRDNKGDDSDLSPVRTKKNNKSGYDSDLSPPRQKKNINQDSKKLQSKNRKPDSDSDLSPPRKKANKDSDSDLSPPRKDKYKDSSPPRKKANKDSDFDLSPPRRDKYKDDSRSYHKDRRDIDRDRNRDKGNRRSRWDADNDRREYKDDKKITKTLEGKTAGLQNARQLRNESDEIRKKEDELFGKLSEDVTGKNAATIKRNLKNRDRQTEAEKAADKEREERQKILDEKYSKWGKGLKQMEEQESRVQNYLHEASKPLARYKDDKDLDQQLRERERLEDPMLEYIQKKRKEKEDDVKTEHYPLYKGPYPPNRFNIRPGHRWDGVDRSTGYEKSYFNMKSSKVAQEEEIYKWSTEDM